jgi:hypothetical protein
MDKQERLAARRVTMIWVTGVVPLYCAVAGKLLDGSALQRSWEL